MNDVDRLRRRLRAALVLPFLGGAAACQPSRPLPTCPSGDWCGPVVAVSALSVADAGTTLACPANIEWGMPTADGGTTAGPSGLPSFGQGALNEKKTRERRAAGDGSTCCYQWFEPCPGGRPLLDNGKPVFAAVRGAIPRLDDELRQQLAHAWLEDARAEHASIASFARATLELLAVGAPPELIAAHQRAALDEVEHARLCFSLASRYAGRELAPGPLPQVAPRPASLARVACDTFVEGCVGETIAALAALRAAEHAPDADALRALRTIADDEAEHAALAWTTVAWAIRTGGDEVRAAVLEAASTAMAGERLTRVRHDAIHGIIEPLLEALQLTGTPVAFRCSEELTHAGGASHFRVASTSSVVGDDPVHETLPV